MLSIHIPAATLQLPAGVGHKAIWSAIAEYNLGAYRQLAPQAINAALEAERDALLNRVRYGRRASSDAQLVAAHCYRCRSCYRRDFRRDGHYSRGLLSLGGVLTLRVPQVECSCGGDVAVSYQALEKWGRIGEDIGEKVRRRVSQGASLREVQQELEGQLQTGVGLRSLNEQVLALEAAARGLDTTKLVECPPVVVVDGVWATWMVETGKRKEDKRGRLRKVKKGERVGILVALGVWPEREEWDILAWSVAPAEDEVHWSAFLTHLQEAGLKLERGLKLLIADGAGGIEAARQMVYGPRLPLQRCVFHKIRNVLKAVHCAQGMERRERQEYRRQLAGEVAAIWEAATEEEAVGRMAVVVAKYQREQPDAMLTLQRDFGATLPFYRVQKEAALAGKAWPARLLRTTSLLERANREIRRAIRRGCAWQSDTGLNIRVWLGILGYRRHKGAAQCTLLYKVAEEALMHSSVVSP